MRRLGVRGRSSGVYALGVFAYLLVLSLIQFLRSGFLIWPDTFMVFLLLAAIVMGHTRSFLRDWIPFAVVLFGWQLLRGYTDNTAIRAGIEVHEADLITAERALFGGHLPTVVLQRALYTPGTVHWYDMLAVLMWAMHFVLPLTFAYLLWIQNRTTYWRFVAALLTLSFAAFLTYVLFPAVPPWLAAQNGAILEGGRPVTVHLLKTEIAGQMEFGGSFSTWIFNKGNPNRIAAMPSLHAAYPTLVFLFTLVYWRRLTPFMVLYCLGLWFSIIYMGEHYVIDVIAGIVYAAASFFAVSAVERLVTARRSKRATYAEPEGSLVAR
ncbi:MAG: phosphatase PAP2 family protein [Chloroflexota bacterium]|nr:phosphatase PAP2 family protein [Chloroflexota bacterium]